MLSRQSRLCTTTSNYANPVATAAVRCELGRLFNLDGHPRSWPKADRLKYNALPIELRIVIDRRETQNTRALRKLQNDFAAFKQKGTLKMYDKKDIHKGGNVAKDDEEFFGSKYQSVESKRIRSGVFRKVPGRYWLEAGRVWLFQR